MVKNKTYFTCQKCGYQSPKWLGRCPDCASWNSFEEEAIKVYKKDKFNVINNENISEPKKILNIKSSEYERYDTGILELNRVLGGGLVKGSLTLISGDPGIGKSTILLQSAKEISNKYGGVLYVSGEESEEQIKMRGDRLSVNSQDLYIVSETNIDIIMSHIDKIKPIFVIIDSIQTLYDSNLTSAPGSVSQVRECSNKLMRLAKSTNIPFFIVAHVTKQGELAGPRVLEHMVDTVLYFEGERTQEFRVLRTIKNRFGTTSEIGVFEMTEMGLQEILNPSEVFLEETNFNQEGSAVVGIIEGTRPLLVEIQSLATETNIPMPRRTAIGIENSRLSLILAVLEKKLRIHFFNCDVYVNVVGGINIEGTFADLGLALSLISSKTNKNFRLNRLLIIGEIGLTGEVRPVSYCEKLVNEGIKMGFENIIIPKRNKEKLQEVSGVNLIGVSSLAEAAKKVF